MDIKEIFLTMESENDMYRKKLDTFSYWIYIRHTIYNLLNESANKLSYSIEPKTGDKLKSIIVSLISPKKKRYKKAEILFLNTNRKMLVDGIYISKEMEGLIIHYKDKALVFEGLYYGRHYKPTNKYDVFYTDRIDLSCMFWTRICCRFGMISKKRREIRELAKELRDIIKRYFNVDSEMDLENLLWGVYCEYLFWYRKAPQILKKVAPKVIFEEDCYCSVRNMVFNEITQEEGVITIEMPHGIMNYGVDYYCLQEKVNQFPKKVFLFSDYWKNVTKIPLKDEDIVSVGCPFLEDMVKKYCKRRDEHKKKIILFISEWVIGKQLSKFAIELNRLLRDDEKYEIKYRLHPGEKIYPELIEAGIFVETGEYKNVYESLAEVDIQIGVRSFALYEGLAYNLETYCVDLPGIEIVCDLEKKGLIKIVHEPKEIVAAIGKKTIGGDRAELRKMLWTENALENMIRTTDDFLQGYLEQKDDTMGIKEKYIAKQKDLAAISAAPSFPKIIKIDICNTCNYACVFCPQSKQINKRGNIDDGLCRKIILDAYNAGAREICLSSTGEPLLNSHLEEYIELAKSVGYTYIFFNTNGYLLNKERAVKIIEAGADSVKISLNAGTRETYKLVHGVDGYEKVLENLKNIYEIRNTLNSSCKIYVSYVAIKQTFDEYHELKNKLLGITDEMMVMNANRRGGGQNEIDEKLYNGDDQYTYQYPCSQLFNNVYISAEGYMNICCQDFENVGVVADLNEMDIKSAWNCKAFVDFRKKYLRGDLKDTLCYNCINNTDEKVIPLDAEKAYFEESALKISSLKDRIGELVKRGDRTDE